MDSFRPQTWPDLTKAGRSQAFAIVST